MTLIVYSNNIDKKAIYNLDDYEKISPSDDVFIPDIKYAVIGYIKGVPNVLFETTTKQCLDKAFGFLIGAYQRKDKYVFIDLDKLKNDGSYDVRHF